MDDKDITLEKSNGKTHSTLENKEKNDTDDTSNQSKEHDHSTATKEKERKDQLVAERGSNIKDEKKSEIVEEARAKPDPATLTLEEYLEKVRSEKFTMADFFKILEAVVSQDRFQQHYGVIGLRKLLAIENPPIQPVIDANLVPRLIEFMKNEDEPQLQFESVWALTNVASGTAQQTQEIIDKGGIPVFVKLLSSPHTEIAKQAIWAIANISGDSTTYRDMILKSGGLDALIKLLKSTTNKETLKDGAWALSNLCRGKPLPKFDLVKNAIVPLALIIKEEDAPEILTDAAWAMSHVSDGDESVIQHVIDADIVPALIKHLTTPFPNVLIPCLRILGNIATGNETQTNFVEKNPGIANIFLKLLDHEKRAVRKDTLWVLSNIAAGTSKQVEVLLRCPGFITKLNQIALTDSSEVRRESAWVLSNALNHGNLELIRFLVDNQVIETMVEKLDEDDSKIVVTALECLKKFLRYGNKLKEINRLNANPILDQLESLNAILKIEKLQEHKSDEVYKTALSILEEFFELGDSL